MSRSHGEGERARRSASGVCDFDGLRTHEPAALDLEPAQFLLGSWAGWPKLYLRNTRRVPLYLDRIRSTYYEYTFADLTLRNWVRV